MIPVHVYSTCCYYDNRYSVRENLAIENVEETVEELKLFKAAGGSTIVDVTSIGIRRVRITVCISHTLCNNFNTDWYHYQ